MWYYFEVWLLRGVTKSWEQILYNGVDSPQNEPREAVLIFSLLWGHSELLWELAHFRCGLIHYKCRQKVGVGLSAAGFYSSPQNMQRTVDHYYLCEFIPR